jgi:septal ring factor EnvC (AmiA/AmiB activator)
VITQARQQAEFYGRLSELGAMLKLQTAVVLALRALAAGFVTDAAMLIVARYRAFTPQPWLLAAVPLALGVLALLAGMLRRYSPQTVAGRTDRRLSLKERLTTALELQRRGDGGVLAEAQISDAMWHLRQVEPWHTFPPHVPSRDALSLTAAAVLTAILIVAPNAGKAAIEHQAAVSTAIQQEAQKLQKTATEIQQDEAQTGNHTPDQQSIEQILQQLQQQLQQPSLSAEDALAKLQAAQQQLQANQDPNADSLAEALQALAAQFDNQPLVQKVAQDIRNGDYNAAAQDLSQAGQQAGSLSADQRDQLAQSLRAAAAAQAKAGNSQLSDSLGQASDALSNGSAADQAAAFRQAAGNLQNAGQRSQAQQSLSKALSQVQQSASNMAQQAGQDAADQGSSFNGDTSSSASDSSSASAADGAQGAGALDQAGTGQGQGQLGQDGQGQGQGSGAGQGPSGDGTGSGGQGTETVYTGSATNFQGVPGQEGSSGQVSSTDDNSLSQPAQNGSNVPYTQVIGSYQQQASQAMDRAAVPLSYREIVKDYFSSLAPQH